MATTTRLWDITKKPYTRRKLALLRDYFEQWLTIWNAPKQRAHYLARTDWYVLDLFAGRGWYDSDDGPVSGSPLVYLERLAAKAEVLTRNEIMVHVVLVEKRKDNSESLQGVVDDFLERHPEVGAVTTIHQVRGDSNSDEVWRSIRGDVSSGAPLFCLVDPYGIKIEWRTVERVIDLGCRSDLLFNYQVAGATRVHGVASKTGELTAAELGTIETYKRFLGEEVILKREKPSPDDFASRLFVPRGFKVVAYDMPYADRVGTLYYLLVATKSAAVARMAKDMFGRSKKEDYTGQMSVLGLEDLKADIRTFGMDD